MGLMELYSEPYSATGGLAAEGVLNQLGRPDIEPLEVLVRESIQNSWDARRTTSQSISVEIGRRALAPSEVAFCREELLVNPPPRLPLGGELHDGVEIMYFADFGTDGLGGPTRADRTGQNRDFVDFVRNIGQPPDKDLGGGSFGYGEAAFYIASGARTILVDTLCIRPDGEHERRFMGCALGCNYELEGRPYTGRHWWGRITDGIPEPLTGDAAHAAASGLGLPERRAPSQQGTTVVLLAPSIRVETEDGGDDSMPFIAEALAWNFWPRMIDTPGAGRRTMEFRVVDAERQVRIPNPRTHQRLRDFVEAMDRLHEDPGEDGDLLLDRSIAALRPARRLGRLTIKKGPVAVTELPQRSVPVGARLTADAVHHVALMRNAELVVRYLPGAVPSVARMGYAGVFKCGIDVDDAFRAAEPPTHDNWVHRAVPAGHDRRYVKIALERIHGVCREAAGYDNSLRSVADGAAVPLGEFADTLASLIPGASGPGARRQSINRSLSSRRRSAPGRTRAAADVAEEWTDGVEAEEPGSAVPRDDSARRGAFDSGAKVQRLRRPQLRSMGDPEPTMTDDGAGVLRYPFEVRGHGNRVRLSAVVEVMSSDGGQVESEAPLGAVLPTVRAWVDPLGEEHLTVAVEPPMDRVDGQWSVEIELSDEAMLRVDLRVDVL
jgi:hypothetical protein